MFMMKYIVPGLCWLLTFMLTFSHGAESKERFSNFYTVPANLELIAMASDGVGDKIQSSNNEPQSDQTSSEAFSSPSSSQFDSSGEPRFSIGLGTLAPSYSQKFGSDGQTRLDFDHRANGFSYTLTNHHHPQTAEPTAFSDTQKDQYSAKESKSDITLSPQPTKTNIKIYHDQLHKPNSPFTSETRNFFSEMRPSSRFYDFSLKSRSRTLNIPDESRYHELVEKYAPKDEEDGLDSFFDKEPSIETKGSWSSSFDDMPDFPDMPGPKFDETETPSSTPEPPHHSPPKSSRAHSSPSSNAPRHGRYHDDDHSPSHPHSHPHSHPRSHPRSHPHHHSPPHSQPRSHLHSNTDYSPDSHPESHRSHSHSHSHPHSSPHSYSNPQSNSRSENPPPPYYHPPMSSRPPPTHHRFTEHSDDSRRGRFYDDSRGYEQGLGSDLSSFESPSPYFSPGSDVDDGNQRAIGSISGPIQFNSNIHHGSDSGELSFSKDDLLLSSSGPAGFEYINRIASSPQDEMNSFTFNSGSLQPLLFSATNEQEQYNALPSQQNEFAAYISGLPLAP